MLKTIQLEKSSHKWPNLPISYPPKQEVAEEDPPEYKRLSPTFFEKEIIKEVMVKAPEKKHTTNHRLLYRQYF